MRLHRSDYRYTYFGREIRGPLPLKIQAFEQKRRCSANRDNIATHLLQLNRDLFGLLESFKKTLALFAAKADERRDDLYAFRRIVVPIGKGLTAMRWLDQTDTRAPCNHLNPSYPGLDVVYNHFYCGYHRRWSMSKLSRVHDDCSSLHTRRENVRPLTA